MNRLATLYDLTATMRHLLDLAQTGEIDQETLEDTIESMDLTHNIESKIDGYAYVMDELKASNERIRNEEKRLAKRRRMQENNYERMRTTLLEQMKLLELDKVKTDKYTVSIRKNPIKVVVRDESNIPKRFYDDQLPKLNRKKLKEHLELTGEELTGVELTREESLQIR